MHARAPSLLWFEEYALAAQVPDRPCIFSPREPRVACPLSDMTHSTIQLFDRLEMVEMTRLLWSVIGSCAGGTINRISTSAPQKTQQDSGFMFSCQCTSMQPACTCQSGHTGGVYAEGRAVAKACVQPHWWTSCSCGGRQHGGLSTCPETTYASVMWYHQQRSAAFLGH